MINYSIVKRINPLNLSTYKYYAAAQYGEVISLSKFAQHIASHGSVYSRADIVAVLIQAVDCMRELLLNGNKIQLGELGNFYCTLRSTGKESPADFSSSCITAVNVNWEQGDDFKTLLQDATFHEVGTREEQAALLKAKKNGTAEVPTDSTDPDDDGDDDSGSDTDSGSGSGSDSGSGSGGTSGGTTTPDDDDETI